MILKCAARIRNIQRLTNVQTIDPHPVFSISRIFYISPSLSSTSSLHFSFIFSRIHSPTLQLYPLDIIRNRERVCSLLVERGALVTSVNNKNWTPLHMESVFPINRT